MSERILKDTQLFAIVAKVNLNDDEIRADNLDLLSNFSYNKIYPVNLLIGT